MSFRTWKGIKKEVLQNMREPKQNEAWSKEEMFDKWAATPANYLGGMSPKEAWKSKEGRRCVRLLLANQLYGVYI